MATTRYRRFSAKVRTGCKTCKTRRVKCDEAKPSCLRCTSTGRICDGYSRPLQVGSSPSTDLQQIPRSGLSSSSGTPDAEQRALHIFNTVIAPSIVSLFDIDFWTHDLLQTATEFKTVQYAVAALAAAYEASILCSAPSFAQSQFVLVQYTKSINSLRQYLGKTKFRTRVQQSVVLITNYLLMFLCAIMGFHIEACLHLRSGLSLMREWGLGLTETLGRKQMRSQKQPSVLKFLVAAFTQLDTQARMKITAMGRHSSAWLISYDARLDRVEGSHVEHQSYTRAFIQLEGMHNKAVQSQHPFHAHRPVDPDIVAEYQQQLLLWDMKFADSLEPDCDTTSTTSFVRTLQMRRLLVQVSWERLGLLPPSETSSPDETCKEIVRLAAQIIQHSRLEGKVLSFNPTGGLIETLWYVATRCEDGDVRWQAIELLEENAIVEGLWESSSAARMAVAAVCKREVKSEDVDY
ncbi:hypothetical protein BJX70DRAFT_371416 [Aspergillus crustosus]